MTYNSKEEALLLATDSEFNIDNKEYLYCDNNDVLTYAEFMKQCKEEVKKEYQKLTEEEINFRTKIVINSINKKNDKNEGELNDSREEQSSLNEVEESDEDSFNLQFSDSNAHESEINQ